jgi:NAD(P)-dependent dehydrogenase (short-subunit alcohol dehydrogenase family)
VTERVALVTGCSTGIGHASALALHEAGLATYATARRPETLADLEAAGCRTLPLDVTDEAARVQVVRAIDEERGGVDVLVNNAGYADYGAVEEISLERWRREFETNLFGAVRLTQLVLPGMRERGHGRIINMSSMGGRMALPLGGAYHGSKFALEAVSDVLRVEVAPFGVDVVLIEPGLVDTRYADTASGGLHEAAEGPYGDLARSVGSQRGRAASYAVILSSFRRLRPMSSSPSRRRHRVKSSMSKVSSRPGALTVSPSRSTTMRVVGSSSTASMRARTLSTRSSTGSRPIFVQLVRKMSAKLGAMTARKPASSIAHGACSRLDPHPKFSPAISTEAPA